MSAEAVFKDEAFAKFLKNLDKNLSSIENGKAKYAGLISSLVYQDVLKHFEQESGPEGSWAPWSDAYKKRLADSGGGGNKKLQHSGFMRQSFKPTNFKSTKNGITWYNNAKTREGFPYAFAHDEGGKTLPQREFMWLSEDAAEKIADQTLAFLLDEGK